MTAMAKNLSLIHIFFGRFERRLGKKLQRVHRAARMVVGKRKLGQARAFRTLPLVALRDKLDDLAVFLGIAIGAQNIEQAAKTPGHARPERPRRYHYPNQAHDIAERLAGGNEHDRRQAEGHRRRDRHGAGLMQP